MSPDPLDTARVQVLHIGADAPARLRVALESARAEQEALADEHDVTFAQLTGQGDVDSQLERELADVSAASAREAIEQIDRALARLDAGTYGICESCGDAIPFERLEAIPHARYCVACPGRGPRLLR